MNVVDPGTIAQNIIATLGGASGGYLILAAGLIMGALSLFHVVHHAAIGRTIAIGGVMWILAFIVRQWIGYA